MKKIVTLLFIGFASVVAARAQEAGRMSASTALLIRDLKQQQAEKVFSKLRQVYCLQTLNGQTYVSAFVRLAPQTTADNLRRHGFLPGGRSGSIVTGMIPLAHLADLTNDAAVSYVEIGTAVQPRMDSVRRRTGVNLVQQGYQLPKAYTGKGVVVGIVDNGFDYTHPNFYDSAYSAYRIKRVWEQGTPSGNPPAGFNYGKELKTKASILNAMTDAPKSHGTHVAGIAAGSGALTGGQFTGVAPNADIVLVDYRKPAEEPTFTNVNIAEGISYIFDYAASVNKPCVVNLSLGSHIGPHDGSSLFDQYCDSLVGPGRILVGASGNEGLFKLYSEKSYGTSDTMRTLLGWPYLPQANNGQTIISAWGEPGKAFRIAVNIYNRTTGQLESSTGFYNASIANEDELVLIDGDAINPDTTLIAISTNINPLNGKPEAFIYIDNSAQDDTSRWLQIAVTGKNTKTKMWAADVLGITYFTSLGKPQFKDGLTTSTMGEIGGTGKRIITVGAYTVRNQFDDLAGNITTPPFNNDNGDLAPFSSKGPTADGRTKPDITAPGNVVISSVNSFDPEYDPTNPFVTNSVTDGTHNWYFGALFGTSMASPVVSGIVALWLEANPGLDPEQVKYILKNTAITDSYTGVIPASGSNDWGWGKIDGYGGAKVVTDVKDVHGAVLFTVYPNPTNGICHISFPQTAHDVTISLADFSGKGVYHVQYSDVAAADVKSIDLSGLPAGVYAISTIVDSVHASGKLILVR